MPHTGSTTSADAGGVAPYAAGLALNFCLHDAEQK